MASGSGEQRSNFGFLSEHAPLLADLGATAERLFPFDPASCVLKLRLLAESLTQEVASRIGLRLQQPTQAELLRAVDQRLGLDAQVRQMFHLLRVRGNEAAHQAAHGIGYREGIEALKVAREVALWFHRSFGSDPDFKPGPFILPDDPSQKLVQLQQQVAALAKDLQQAQTEQAAKEQLATLLAAQAEQERELATRAHEERGIYESLADEASTRYAALKAEFDTKLQAAAAQPAAATAQDVQRFSQRAFRAAQQVTMDEAAIRETEPGAPLHCGHAKGGDFDEDKAISPLDDGCEQRFMYGSRDGAIYPVNKDDEAAKYMIALLRLDLGFLSDRRAEALLRAFDDAFVTSATDDDLVRLAQAYRLPDGTGQMTSFGHVLSRYAEQLLGRVV